MKNKYTFKNLILILVLLLYGLLLNSCEDDTTPTLYEDLPNAATPVITSISPSDTGLAGITVVTINGENFSSEASKNIVFFQDYKAEILTASATQLVVRAPNLVKDSTEIKVGVQDAPLFSDVIHLNLKSSIAHIYPFQDFEIPYAIAVDSENDVFCSFIVSGNSTGISKITKGATIESFSPKGGESAYSEIRIGSNGQIYGARIPPVRALFTSAEGSAPEFIIVSDDALEKLFYLDIDNNMNFWTFGIQGFIYSISPDEATVNAFPVDISVQALRFYDGYLYAAGVKDSVQSIWRFQVNSAENLGSAEQYFNITENLEGYTVNAITFSEDGKLFMGTSAEGLNPNTIVYLEADKTMHQFYPGVLSGPVLHFSWGTGIGLYYTLGKAGDSQLQSVVRINTGMRGAPYYGRD